MATMTITVPNAAVPLIREVCIADGWDQVSPATLSEYVQLMMVRLFRQKIVELRAVKAQQDIQVATVDAITTATSAFE